MRHWSNVMVLAGLCSACTGTDDDKAEPSPADSDTVVPTDTIPPDDTEPPAPSNTAPTAPEVSFETAPVTTTDDLIAVLTSESTDADGDDVTYTWAWTQDGEPVPSLAEPAVSATLTARGETWTVTVTPEDGETSGPSAEASITIGDAPPTISSIEVLPSIPTELTVVACSVNALDPDGDELSINTGFTVNTKGYPGTSGLNGDAFEKGDAITCTAVATANGQSSDPITSAPVTVGNSPPSFTDVLLTPNPSFPGALLTATPVAADPDSSDILQHTWTWAVNGATVVTATGESFDTTGLVVGDSVSVSVTTSDGSVTLGPLTATTVLSNGAPSIDSVVLDAPPVPTIFDTLTCLVGDVEDPEGDAFTLAIRWFVNGVASPLEGETFDLWGTPAFATVACVAEAEDALGNTASLTSDAVTVKGVVDVSQPFAPFTAFNPLVSGEIDPATDRDFWGFDLLEGETVQVIVDAFALGSSADLVMRVYDGSGNLLGENDTLMFEYRETDPGLMFTAPADDTYIFEVLEASDAFGATPLGGPGYTYDLGLVFWAPTEVESTNNDIPTLLAAPPTTTYTSVLNSYAGEFFGIFDTPGDLDLYPLDLTAIAPPDGRYVFVSTYENPLETTPRLSLFREDGSLLASTEAPHPDGWVSGFLDHGVFTWAPGGQTYIIGVEDIDGYSGPSSFYAGHRTLYFSTLAPRELEPNDTTATANPLQPLINPGIAGFPQYRYIRHGGALPPGDTADLVTFDTTLAGTYAGHYLTVQLSSLGLGQQSDTRLRVLDAQGNVLDEADVDVDRDDHPDPALYNVVLPDNNPVTVEILQDATGPDDAAHQYIVLFQVNDTPL